MNSRDIEKTEINNIVTDEQTIPVTDATSDVNPEKGGHKVLKRVAVGTGAGILLGTLSSFVVSDAIADNVNAETETDDLAEPKLVEPQHEEVYEPIETLENEWSDGGVAVATGVTDEMSFGKAFATARSEVGTGGAFEWRGGVYSTFTAEEWSAMSQQEIDEYNSHFSWGASDSSTVEMAEVDGGVLDDTEIEILSVDSDDEAGLDISTLIVNEDDAIYFVDVNPENEINDLDVCMADIDSDISDSEIFDIFDDNMEIDDLSC